MTAPTLGLTFIPAPLWRPVADVDDAPLNFGNKKPGIAPGFFYNSCNRGAATRPVANLATLHEPEHDHEF